MFDGDVCLLINLVVIIYYLIDYEKLTLIKSRFGSHLIFKSDLNILFLWIDDAYTYISQSMSKAIKLVADGIGERVHIGHIDSSVGGSTEEMNSNWVHVNSNLWYLVWIYSNWYIIILLKGLLKW